MAAALGIYKIHRRVCPAFRNAKANCTCGKKATWQAHVPAKRKGGKPMRKHFKTRADAIEWRDTMGAAVARGEVTGSRSTATVGEAADKLIEGMRAGTVVDRSARRFKPSTIRGYARSVDNHLPRWFLRLSCATLNGRTS